MRYRTLGGSGLRVSEVILGARRAEQIRENLGALDVRLSAEDRARLEAVTGFRPGFPSDFIAETSPWVFGAALV
jgi:aryl-alcohol dehydrogenase-like predicted oxidoreductase